MSEYHLHILFCKDYGKENEIMGGGDGFAVSVYSRLN